MIRLLLEIYFGIGLFAAGMICMDERATAPTVRVFPTLVILFGWPVMLVGAALLWAFGFFRKDAFEDIEPN